MSDSAAAASDFRADLTDPVMYENPWPTFSRLRNAARVAPAKTKMAGRGALVVTRYDDVVALYKDPRFSNNVVKHSGIGGLALFTPRIFRLLTDSMVFKDDPDHRRLRQLVDGTFTRRMIETLTGSIETVTARLIDDMAARAARGETIDLVRSFATPLPLTVISEMLGVPDADRDQFHHWVNQFLDAPDGGAIQMLKMIPTAHRMMKLFERIVALRRREPDDRVITALVNLGEGDEKLGENEILAMIFLLLLAGHETTTSLIGSGVLALIEHPDQMARLRDDPSLIDSAVEELLRYTSPVTCGAARIALEDVELGGMVIPKGARVLGMLNSANHDERAFPNPEQLDLARQPNRHVAFGMGIHLCLGLWLARLEGQIALNALVQRFPDMRLAAARSELRWKPGESLRGLRRLPLRLQAG